MKPENTFDIPPAQWIRFFADFTRENSGSHAQLEVLGAEPTRIVEVEDRPFRGISADVKDGENVVWIALGDTPVDHLSHGIYHVTDVKVRLATAKEGAALEFNIGDGTKTLLQLTRPEDYALPPGDAAKS